MSVFKNIKKITLQENFVVLPNNIYYELLWNYCNWDFCVALNRINRGKFSYWEIFGEWTSHIVHNIPLTFFFFDYNVEHTLHIWVIW